MIAVKWQVSTLLMALVLMLGCGAAERDFPSDYETISAEPYQEYVRHIHSMIDAYRGDVGGRLVIETNALIATKYRTWKRNADIINSLLALPKGMNDAGR